MQDTVLLHIKTYDHLLWIHLMEPEDLAAYPNAYSDIFWQVSVMIATKIKIHFVDIDAWNVYLFICTLLMFYITVIHYLLYSVSLQHMQESQGIFISNSAVPR